MSRVVNHFVPNSAVKHFSIQGGVILADILYTNKSTNQPTNQPTNLDSALHKNLMVNSID
jgi:hypothetical protein